jgi:hypothetical protein
MLAFAKFAICNGSRVLSIGKMEFIKNACVTENS